MDLNWSAAEIAFRDALRAWLAVKPSQGAAPVRPRRRRGL